MTSAARRIVFVAILLWLGHSTPAHACPICFGGDGSPLLDAARLGVLTMALVTVGVLAAFARWMLRLRALSGKESCE